MSHGESSKTPGTAKEHKRQDFLFLCNTLHTHQQLLQLPKHGYPHSQAPKWKHPTKVETPGLIWLSSRHIGSDRLWTRHSNLDATKHHLSTFMLTFANWGPESWNEHHWKGQTRTLADPRCKFVVSPADTRQHLSERILNLQRGVSEAVMLGTA